MLNLISLEITAPAALPLTMNEAGQRQEIGT